MSTHNVRFRSKIRKLGVPLQTSVFQYKSGVYWGKHFRDMFSCYKMTWTCFPVIKRHVTLVKPHISPVVGMSLETDIPFPLSLSC